MNGDILEIDNNIKRTYELKNIMYVDFVDGSFYLKDIKEDNWSLLKTLSAIINIEGKVRGKVIGNIYENKNLLGQEDK